MTRKRALTTLAWLILLTAYGLGVVATWMQPRMDASGKLGVTALLTMFLAALVALSATD